MIIKIDKLTKQYEDEPLFKDFSFEFKDSGFYVILGDSGSGKTTLLNILSLIDNDYRGKLLIDNKNTSNFQYKEKCTIRSTKFSYIFQNYNLLEDDTVENNVLLMLDAISNLNKEFKLNKVNEILKLLKIDNLKNEYVRNLSGGEKQRVAIARSIVIDPEVIFCDEPTGALDTNNTENIFEILRNLSINAAVICVTHDRESAYKYADYILELKHRRIKIIKIKRSKKNPPLKIMKLLNKNNSSKLRFKYIFRYLQSRFKVRKFRNIIKSIFLSISLISSGLSICLSSGINNSLVESFKNIIDQNVVVLNKKNSKNEIFDFYSSGINDVASLMNKYKEYLDYFGCNYIVDFENFFPDVNNLFLLNSGKTSEISGFNIRMFNEFVYITDYNNLETYPLIVDDLNDDEIIISFNFDTLKSICFDLKIERTISSLSNYLKTHNLYVNLRVKNDSRQYSDEQIFKIKAFILDTKNRIYHTNPLFNTVLFEENMKFPVSNRLNKIEEYPWIFKKVFYVHTKKFQTYFLNEILYDQDYKDYLFDSDNNYYSPLTCAYNTQSTNKLYVYNIFKDSLDIGIINHLNDIGFKYKSYYFSTSQGYFNNGTSLFTGFSRPVFLSKDISKIESIIDAHSKVSEEDYLNIKVPDNVVDGYAFKPSTSNLKLKSSEVELLPNEIIVSNGFKNIIGEEVVNQEIYISMLVGSEEYNGEIRNSFETITLTIKDVVKEDNSVSIYQNKEFSLSLFRDLFKISAFSLIPTSIIFETNGSMSKKDIEKLNGYFAEYEISNPILAIEESVNESMKFLNYLLYAFTIVSIISSLILLVIISLVNALESKKEIAIFTILGFDRYQILKIFVIDNMVQCFASYILSSISLLFIISIVGNLLSSSYGLSTINLANPMYLLVNFLIILFLSIASSIATLGTISHIELEKNLH